MSEAASFLRRLKVVPAPEFYALQAKLKQEAWTMSKIAQLKQIQGVLDDLAQNIQRGGTFEEWQKNYTAQGLPRHYLETVYRTACLRAYNAGKWVQFRAQKENRPILRYSAINDSRTRPHHQALHGFMAPVDNVAWKTLAPPNGFNCRCTLMSLSARQAAKLGYKGTVTAPEYVDEYGIRRPITPDKGWESSPENSSILALLREKEKKAGFPPTHKVFPEPLPSPEQWQEVAKIGEQVWTKHLPELERSFVSGDYPRTIRKILKAEGVDLGAPPRVNGEATERFQNIIKSSYPRKWVERANEAGRVLIRNFDNERGFQLFIKDEATAAYLRNNGARIKKYKPFAPKKNQVKAGDSFLQLRQMTRKEAVPTALEISIHEYAHRLQFIMPELDAYFMNMWLDRTRGEKTRPLNDILKEQGEKPVYNAREKGRADHFLDLYFGKNYGSDDEPKPLEMLSMSYQLLLAGKEKRKWKIYDFYHKDPEMLYLALGLLLRYQP